MSSKGINILHIITGLGQGGAEVNLLNLLSSLDRNYFNCSVVSLTGDGPLGEAIRALGIPVMCLNAEPGFSSLNLIPRLKKVMSIQSPECVQTWMYHADLVGGLAARLVGSLPVIWTILHSPENIKEFKPSTRWVVRINAWLSGSIPTRIICNASAGQKNHIRLGFDGSKIQVIPNGFDLDMFKPDPDARRSVRLELGLSADVRLIGLCARFHPHKDHLNFVRAAAELYRELSDVHFMLWGPLVDVHNEELMGWLNEYGLLKCSHLLGQRHDQPRLLAALDLAALSSASEAFPNVIGEAMACGVPCVVTDVGDTTWIVGETGRVVPPHNPSALASAWKELLSLDRTEWKKLSDLARQRVDEHFSHRETVEGYTQLYTDIISSVNVGKE